MSDVVRTRILAASLVAAPALTLAAHLVQATPAQHDTASELAAIAAHPGRYQAASALGFLSMVLFVPAFWAMARPLWDRRPGWAATGLSLSIVGLLALVSLMGAGPMSLAMVDASADRAQMISLTDRYESTALVGVWSLLMVVGYSIGPVVLGWALWRCGLSWAVPALLTGGAGGHDARRRPVAARAGIRPDLRRHERGGRTRLEPPVGPWRHGGASGTGGVIREPADRVDRGVVHADDAPAARLRPHRARVCYE